MTRLTFILLFTTIAALIALSGVIENNLSLRRDKENLEVYLKDHKAKAEFYVNKYDQEVARNISLELSSKNMKKLREDESMAFLKKFNGLKKNLKNLESATRLKTETVIYDTIVLVEEKETVYDEDITNIPTLSFKWANEHTNLEGVIKGKDMKFKVSHKVDIDIVVYHKKKWFLGKKHFYAEAVCSNPDTKITGLDNIRVINR